MRLFVLFELLFVLSVPPLVAGEPRREDVRHIILAFDDAGTSSWRGTDLNVFNKVKEYLFHYSGEGLLRENDFFSIVGFKGDFLNSDNWDEYVYFKQLPSIGSIVFQPGRNAADLATRSSRDWRALVDYSPFRTDQGYSLLSIAKPFILRRLGLEPNRPLVTQTFIILVTDHRYNGNDFYNELKFFLDNNRRYSQVGIKIDDVLSKCYQVEQEYCIKRIDNWESNREHQLSHNVELFEVHPNQDYLTLPAVLEYPPSLPAKRTKNREFEFSLTLDHPNPHYQVHELRVYLHDKKSGAEILIDTIKDLDEYTKSFTFAQKDGFTEIRMEADLKLEDGFYGCTLLTPETVPGLKQTVSLDLEEKERLLGMVDMPNWMWKLIGCENQADAASWLSVLMAILITIVIIIGFLAFVHSIQRYKPSIDDVDIVFYD